jgi:hypothetical protein
VAVRATDVFLTKKPPFHPPSHGTMPHSFGQEAGALRALAVPPHPPTAHVSTHLSLCSRVVTQELQQHGLDPQALAASRRMSQLQMEALKDAAARGKQEPGWGITETKH